MGMPPYALLLSGRNRPTAVHHDDGALHVARLVARQERGERCDLFRLPKAVTRGKRLVVLVGQKKAVAIAVRNVSGRRRWSKLDDWLRLGAPRIASVAS